MLGEGGCHENDHGSLAYIATTTSSTNTVSKPIVGKGYVQVALVIEGKRIKLKPYPSLGLGQGRKIRLSARMTLLWWKRWCRGKKPENQ